MSDLNTPQPPASREDWGYFGTLGWVMLAYLISTIVTIGGMYAWNPAIFSPGADLMNLMKDAWFISVSTIVGNALFVGLLIAAVRMVRWTATDYLALYWPNRQEVLVALISLAVLLPAMDAVAYLVGQPIIPPFATDIYRNAQATGTLLLLWIAIVIAAPVAEEIVFRGYIYRGWVRSARVIPPILVISALFAIIHLQYNWFGILQVFCVGLLLTWTRHRSGSALLPMAMHVITNLYAMIQTVLVVRWWP